MILMLEETAKLVRLKLEQIDFADDFNCCSIRKAFPKGCWDSRSSSSCMAPTSFYFDCETEHGYVEDPDMAGEMTILDVKKQKDCYLLKIKFKREDCE